MPGDDFIGERGIDRPRLPTAQYVEQKLDRFPADFRHRLAHGSERRIDIPGHLDVVEADDRHIAGA